jgi:hypothetical protein
MYLKFCMGEIKGSCRDLVGIQKRKKPPEKTKRRWKFNYCKESSKIWMGRHKLDLSGPS